MNWWKNLGAGAKAGMAVAAPVAVLAFLAGFNCYSLAAAGRCYRSAAAGYSAPAASVAVVMADVRADTQDALKAASAGSSGLALACAGGMAARRAEVDRLFDGFSSIPMDERERNMFASASERLAEVRAAQDRVIRAAGEGGNAMAVYFDYLAPADERLADSFASLSSYLSSKSGELRDDAVRYSGRAAAAGAALAAAALLAAIAAVFFAYRAWDGTQKGRAQIAGEETENDALASVGGELLKMASAMRVAVGSIDAASYRIAKR